MSDIHLGAGALGGRGVYASRAFAPGEVVLAYELQALTREEYLARPEHDRLFVHSYGGERWLYPPPARFVNHADDPNTRQDFERGRAVARRPIEAGEPITTDARVETARELETFLAALQASIGAGDAGRIEALVDAGATGWLQGHGPVDRGGLAEALLPAGRDSDTIIGSSSGQEPVWIVGTGRWDAVCSYDLVADGRPAGHVTDVLQVIDGNWQLVHRHRSGGAG